MSEEEFIEKLSKINDEFLKDDDRENLHIQCDDLIKEFLLKNKFYKVYTEYNIISTEFWYA